MRFALCVLFALVSTSSACSNCLFYDTVPADFDHTAVIVKNLTTGYNGPIIVSDKEIFVARGKQVKIPVVCRPLYDKDSAGRKICGYAMPIVNFHTSVHFKMDLYRDSTRHSLAYTIKPNRPSVSQ